jgi:hypothetical protein
MDTDPKSASLTQIRNGIQGVNFNADPDRKHWGQQYKNYFKFLIQNRYYAKHIYPACDCSQLFLNVSQSIIESFFLQNMRTKTQT